jgi:dTDP-4-amino-4,6-dideoxygalactose transaminase
MCELKDGLNRSLLIIEDAAHALGSTYKTGEKIGSCKYSDMTVFSFHPVKSITTGEGGIITTNNYELYLRLLRLRSHGITKLNDEFRNPILSQTNGTVNPWYYEMIQLGFNYRMTEIEAAIAVSQLKKLDSLVDQRRQICEKIIDIFASVEGIEVPKENSQFLCSEDSQCKKSTKTIKHTYYYLPFKLDEKKLGMTRSVFVSALQKEGIPLGEGGYKPVYLQSMYQKQIAYGSKNFPFKAPYYRGNVSYNPGLCPVAERMWFKELFYFKSQSYVPSLDDIEKFSIAINKVLSHKKEINSLTR